MPASSHVREFWNLGSKIFKHGSITVKFGMAQRKQVPSTLPSFTINCVTHRSSEAKTRKIAPWAIANTGVPAGKELPRSNFKLKWNQFYLDCETTDGVLTMQLVKSNE